MQKKCTKAVLSGKSTKPIGIQPKKKKAPATKSKSGARRMRTSAMKRR